MGAILFNQLICRKTALIILATVFFHSLAISQTRFYLNTITASSVSPAFNAGWNVTTGANRYEMNPIKDGSTLITRTSSAIGGVAVRKALIDQWVSEPLAAQTINGTFTGQIQFNLNNTTSTTGQGFVYLRVINSNGTIASEVGSSTTSNLTTTLTNRALVSLPIVGLNITAGQMLAIEVGWNYSVGTSTTRTGTSIKGSSSGTDLTAADNSQTGTTRNPWVEFSQTLTFLPPPPPANDDCAGAISLTPATSCTNITGTLNSATANGTVPLGCFAAGTYYDVWYKFVATTITHTVNLSGLGANFTAPRIQIYDGTCGALNSIACASGTSLLQTGLTIGTTYYVRIANFNTNPSGSGTVADFSICVTSQTPPANDDCSGATLLTSGTSCTSTAGTFINATPTSGLPSCGNSGSADVWYRFVAQSNRPVITLTGMGINFSGASPLIQLFTGSCGALTQVACAASPLNTAVTPGGIGLSINSTYYIRVTSNTNTGILTSGTWGFGICVQDPSAAAVDYAKSYINVTDGTVGGTIDPGDILEIRATIVVARPGNTGSIVAIDSLAFYDTLSANKGFELLKDSMALKTNEGKLFRPSTTTYFTDASDADAAWITTAGAGTDTALQINMGLTANRFVRSKLRSNSKPSNFGSTCIIMATYRVRVNAPYGTTINYGGGSFRYRDTITNIFYTITFPRDSLRVYSSPGACPDAISPTNVIGDEVNGTFGVTAGSPVFNQNRGTTPNTNYSYAPFGAGSGPGDYFYSVANNTSASGTTVQTIAKPNTARVFSVWDITGDHTGATNTAKGNPPCNLSAPVSAANPCGYMLVVNSAYRSDVAFQFNFNGACTETYYEISAWIKNICSKCGCDSNGVGAQNTGYIPTAANDSAGVRPNIAFEINGVDYYTTGDLVYQGLGGTQTGTDTLNKWVKRSFVYKTKPNETGFMMTFRNNAPGGGGNDWALDDISIRTCYPNMTYSPSSNPSVCTGRTLTISDTVRSYYDVYIYYKWQRSTDGGANWTDIAGTNGVATPVLVGPNNYQFINSYTLPPSATAVSNNGDLYRMVVATNAVNLAGTSCNYSDVSPVTLTVLNNCIDIDDDNDGIPDYVEFNNPVALQDADGDLIPNWNDATYPGYVDYNLDLVNDNFDYGADANNNGIPNYLDPTFPGFVDSNGDGVNDNADKDLDGIPNQYDLDSDNDGIPDVVESYGVDTDGNGIIDNYVDTDLDGFSQNVDANATGVTGSGNGLGAQDFDGDGIPNYLDTDSDNDGIPDVVEAGGSYTTNNGRLANFVDANKDGISDNNVGATTGLLKTGGDISPVDGRADNYPNKNLDRDFRPNAYDLDSDGDGIADVIEADLPDANLDGKADGALGTNGWSTTVAALPALTLPNTDGVGNPNYLDIDSDDDGIPDNIEGQSTLGYKLPTATDADGDGMVTPYDNFVGYGGSGIFPYDKDSDGIPDYIDTDTDSDGLADIVEGNDWNLNGLPDEVVTLTGLDTDGDGLDNRFDSLNSVTNLKGTSYMMGTGGTFTGDPVPGTKATVQKTLPVQIDRDWRDLGSVLPVQFLNFAGAPQGTKVDLSWIILATKDIDHFEIERSTDNTTYIKAGVVQDAVKLNVQQTFGFTDDISNVNSDIIYYKLKVIGKTGEIKYSNVLVVRNSQTKTLVNIIPNPAYNYANINLYADKNTQGKITIIDKVGRKVFAQDTKFSKGYNNIYLSLDKYSEGIYTIVIESSTEKIIKQLVIIR